MLKTITPLIIVILTAHSTQAQFIKNTAINAQVGYALTLSSNSEEDAIGNGLFLQGELVLEAASWIEFRPYAGLIITNSDGEDLNQNPTDEIVESKAFLFGGKVRVRAPIPWVAPYLEIGLGASIGQFETFTASADINKSGIIYHIPFAFGLELGKNNNVDLGFAYYVQPTVEQFAGAFALGITIPL